MFKKITFLLFVIVAFLFSLALEAVEVKGLYQANVAVNSQNNSDRAKGLKKALAAVMIKVGGKKNVLNNAVIKKSLHNYRLYLNQYQYQHKPLQVVDTPSIKKQLFLLASFNEDKINQLFQEANLPLWGNLRPKILLWLVDENGLTRTMVSTSSGSSLPSIVSDFSQERGLPITMPLMDLTDVSQVSLSDVWGRFQQPIKVASNRYFAEAIVVVRVSNSSLLTLNDNKDSDSNLLEANNCGLLCAQSQSQALNYVLDWSIIGWETTNEQPQFSQRYQGNTPDKLLLQGLSDITDLIYQRYALSTIDENNFVIEVANVNSLATYVEVFDFLSNLSSVKAITLQSANGNVRRFSLQLVGSSETLLASLKLSKQLIRYEDPLSQFNIINEEGSLHQPPIFHWGRHE